MDHLALLLKDPSLTVANRTEAEWQRKVKEDERRRKQQKLHVWEHREEADSDDDEEEDDEVVANIEWDDLESEDMLIGTHSSMQGSFPFHARGSESVRPTETG